MSATRKRRIDKLEAPLKQREEGTLMAVIYTAPETPLETAMEILGLRMHPEGLVIQLDILPPGSPPSFTQDTQPDSSPNPA